VGYRGKVHEQERARELRLQAWTVADIASALNVSKSSVSLWVRDIPIEIRRHVIVDRRPNALQRMKLAEIEECNAFGIERIGVLGDDAFLAAGVALYAGEGAKRDGKVSFANSDPAMMRFFCTWLRHFFVVDESRLRARVYLHEGLDLAAAEAYWSRVLLVPREQFNAPYRAKADPSIRRNKHEHGCAYLDYHCSRTHRKIMGLIRALLSSPPIPG
jgi:hypothetical protein